MQHDDAKGITTFTGNVVLTRGNARIQGDRLVITQDAAGNQTAQTTGNPAVFRQRREGTSQLIEGFGRRIDYESRNERVTLSGQARINRFLCDGPADSITGATIVYDARTEMITVDGQRSTPAQARGTDDGAGTRGRVRVVIQPRQGGSHGEAQVGTQGGTQAGTQRGAQAGSQGEGSAAPDVECPSGAPLRLQSAPAISRPPPAGPAGPTTAPHPTP